MTLTHPATDALVEYALRETPAGLSEGVARTAQEIVLDTLALDSAKTKDLQALVVDGLGIDRKVLIVHDDEGQNIARAAGNHPRIKAVRALEMNVYDLLNHEYLVLSRAAAGARCSRLAGSTGALNRTSVSTNPLAVTRYRSVSGCSARTCVMSRR